MCGPVTVLAPIAGASRRGRSPFRLLGALPRDADRYEEEQQAPSEESLPVPQWVRPEGWPANVTTLVIRRIPTKISQRSLLEGCPQDGSFDFVFLPFSNKQRRAAGYVFVNFTSEMKAFRFYRRYNMKPCVRLGIFTPLSIGVATIQGLEANVLAHRHLADVRELSQPAVFQGTERVPFAKVVRWFADPTDNADASSETSAGEPRESASSSTSSRGATPPPARGSAEDSSDEF